MSSTTTGTESGAYRIDAPLNDHGTVTLRARDRPATYHVVEFADPDLRETIGGLSEGDTVFLTLRRAGPRANVWTAV